MSFIYKSAASSYWQFRVFHDGAQRKRSTKLEDKAEALKQAKKHHIQFLPIMPRVRTEDTPRGYFDSNQYTKLWQTAKSNEGKIYEFRTKAGVVYRRTTITRECYELIMFMRNTFTRPSDIPVIKHRHVYHVQRGDLRLIELRHPTTKIHNGKMASTPQAVEHYRRICEARVKVGRGKPDDYVFMPEMANRASALKELARQFTAVLRLAGLKTDAVGKDRTMYSLRHTSIMAALLAGSSHDERIKLKK